MKKKQLLIGLVVGLLVIMKIGTANATSIPLGASQDTFVGKVYFSGMENTNYGSTVYTHHWHHEHTSLFQDAHSYYQFDLTSYSSTGLVSATLNLNHNVQDDYGNLPTNPYTYKMNAYQVLEAWDENIMTYNTKPNVGTDVVGTVSFVALKVGSDPVVFEGEVSMDITPLVTSWMTTPGSNYGIKYFQDSNFLANGHSNTVWTREHSDSLMRPELVLVYEDGGAQPVPEPATIFLLGFGLAGLAGFKIRRNMIKRKK